ncbi:MAG: hypothetical protein A3J28_02715 [Acidobacteria bacterium RIFCSPLOWO2_12_FULL_60_22]|nr:MAG: hypothetical protein A3J28_02715 [Acidobacteria bacterium RIFCSPLOWO2_12_FULL_60_22]
MRGLFQNQIDDQRRSERNRHRTEADRWEGPSAWLGRAVVGAALLLTLGWMAKTARAQRPPEPDEAGSAVTGTPERSQPSKKPAEVPPPPAGMVFTTHLEHTAVWVGDQFRYTIIVDHSPNYEFVLDTLGKETVNMDPFQVVDVAKKTVNLKNGNKRLYLDITLTSFATGKPSEQIPQLTLFYFRRERGVVRASEAAAESLTVPGPVVGLRTTLPPAANDIRDAITVSTWPRSRWVLAGAGAISLFVLVVGLGWETVAFVRRRKTRRGPDRRKAMLVVRERWLSGVPGDFSNTESTIRFYDQSYQDLKEYVGYFLETPAMGLTADELQAEMQRLGSNRELTEKIIQALGTLEMVRYSRNGTALSPETAQKTAQELREIFAMGSRR